MKTTNIVYSCDGVQETFNLISILISECMASVPPMCSYCVITRQLLGLSSLAIYPLKFFTLHLFNKLSILCRISTSGLKVNASRASHSCCILYYYLFVKLKLNPCTNMGVFVQVYSTGLLFT